MTCDDCIPEIEYVCSAHRLENQCGGCNRTDQKLIATGIGILCKECARSQGLIFI